MQHATDERHPDQDVAMFQEVQNVQTTLKREEGATGRLVVQGPGRGGSKRGAL